MEKYYRFAGLDFLIDLADERAYRDERWLGPFRVDSVQSPHCFHYEIVDALVTPGGTEIVAQPGFRIYREGDWTVRYIGSVQESWDRAYIRAAHRVKEHQVQLKSSQFPAAVGVNTVLNSMMIEHLIARNGGYVFHTSYIQRDGKAILFTAPSGTGKSTQAELWKELRGVEIVNGDRAAVRIVGGEILADGIPFSGSSRYCLNRTLPIAAVVYLRQAPITTIRRVCGVEAFFKIWEGVSVNTWDKEDVDLVSGAVKRVVEQVPVFQLSCTPDESAVLALEQALRKQETL